MIIVTGGAGFIGSNIIKALNHHGEDKIIVVDDLTDGRKFRNLSGLNFLDYIDKDDFLQTLPSLQKKSDKIRAVFHQGACSETTEWNGKFMLKNNYDYSKAVFHFCQTHRSAFIYASSAAVYGPNACSLIQSEFETPLNVYGYSKLLFDQYIRRHADKTQGQVTGLRYFNVYGPHEQHKDKMASVAFHCREQLLSSGKLTLFEGSGGYENGGQRRDFIYVKDVAKINLWFLENPEISGIFNAGTGKSASFNDVANAVIKWRGQGEIVYIPFPEHLKNCYQHFTQADISGLKNAGYRQPFWDVASGIKDYLDDIDSSSIE